MVKIGIRLSIFILFLTSCGDGDASSRILSEEEREQLIEENNSKKLEREQKLAEQLADWEKASEISKLNSSVDLLQPRGTWYEESGRFQPFGKTNNSLLDTKTGDIYFLEATENANVQYIWKRQVEFAIQPTF